MERIKTYFEGVGRVDKAGKDRDSLAYVISSRKLISTVVLPHFDKYPLITEKQGDYLLFREIIMKMERGEHLTMEGLQTIVNLRASLNKGLSPALLEAFPNSVLSPRPQFPKEIVDPC